MENKNNYYGTSFGTLLQIAFIVLKLCGIINWSWVWVLAPLWIGAIITVILIICLIITVAIKDKK